MEDVRQSGKIAAQIREYAISLCVEDARHVDIADKVEAKTVKLGGKPAFPMDISVNGMAAHDCPFPNDPRVIHKGDVVKLDMGVHVNGYVTDTACTVEVGTKKYADLIRASHDAVMLACKLATEPGTKLCDIGKAISETIVSFGYTPITNLSGHGIGHYIVHDEPTVPNYNNNDRNTLKEGMCIAIEPFATTGVGQVSDGKPAGIYRFIQRRPVRLDGARKLIMHLEKEYNTLPFTVRWLKDFPNAQFLLQLFEREGVVHQYMQLPEKSNGIVSQTEHSVQVGYGILTQ